MFEITLDGLEEIEISPAVRAFMVSNGNSHVTLIHAWLDDHQMRDDINLLYQQLAYSVLVSKKQVVATRVLGRISRVRRKRERMTIDSVFTDVLS